MARFSSRIAAGAYRPKKRKRQRRQRSVDRMKARKNYRKNRGILRQRAKVRYKQVRHNPLFKRKKKIYRKRPHVFKRLGPTASVTPSVNGDDHRITHAIEFVMRCGGEVQAGAVTAILAEDWMIEYQLDDGTPGTLNVEDFFDCAVLFEENDIDVIFEILDEAAGLEDDEGDDITAFEFADPTPDPVRVAFNKEQPSELLNQLVKVLDKASTQASGVGRKELRDASSRVKALTRSVADAWEKRNEE